MWYWQHKNIHKSLVGWIVLWGLMSLFHLVMLIILFFIYRDSVSHLIFSIGSYPKLERRPIEFHVALETTQRPSRAPVPVIPVAKKIPAAKTQKAVSIAKEIKKEPVKKNVPQVKKQSSSSPDIPKKALPIIPQAKAPLNAPSPTLSPPEHLDVEIKANKDIKGFEQEYTDLYQTIASAWSPPSGIPPDVACTITVAIDRQGAITALSIDASSGMLMYDVAAQAALSEFQFPHIAWGKSITIIFTV